MIKFVCWGFLVGMMIHGGFSVRADDPDVMAKFDWEIGDMNLLNRSPVFQGNPYAQSVGLGGVAGQPEQLSINYSLPKPMQLTIRVVGPALASRVTAKHFAIVGRVSYEGVKAGSYLEMWSYFAAPGGTEGAYFSRTLGDSGPMASLGGSDGGRDFLLPFDATQAKTPLHRIEFNLHLTGPGVVHLWDVKLVQYPDAAQPARTSPVVDPEFAALNAPQRLLETQFHENPDGTIKLVMDGTTYTSLDTFESGLRAENQTKHPTQLIVRAERALDGTMNNAFMAMSQRVGIPSWEYTYPDASDSKPAIPTKPAATATWTLDLRSYALGIVSALALILAVFTFGFLFRSARQFRHARELRRIASLDG